MIPDAGFDPWTVVVSRDQKFDGELFYGVTSTHVYCRPSCPSRRPKRQNARFFLSCEDAEAAGFRACRRCRPRLAGSDTSRLACRVAAQLEKNPNATLEQLGNTAGLSPFHLQRVFGEATGVSPRAFAEERRRQQLQSALRESPSVTAAVFDAGFTSSSRAYARASEELGMTPSVFRQGGAGASIEYAVTACDMGHLLIGTTGRGICTVRLGDCQNEVEEQFHADFSLASRQRSERLADIVDRIMMLVAGRPARADLPLDIRATAFQRRVWDYLRKIPRGETRTYSEVAADIGQPTAARAVARACATNEVALVIPCHRVIGSTGDLSGYRWGIERKRALLKRERA